jgi:hypothetical protein
LFYANVPVSQIAKLNVTISGNDALFNGHKDVTVTVQLAGAAFTLDSSDNAGWTVSVPGSVLSKVFTVGRQTTPDQHTAQLCVRFNAPQVAGTSRGTVTVSSSAGGGNPSVQLEGQAITPPAMKFSLLVDRSEKMAEDLGGAPRFERAADAARTAINLLTDRDELEVISFAETAKTNLPLRKLTSEHREAALALFDFKGRLSPLKPHGRADIGGATRAASSDTTKLMLTAGVDETHRSLQLDWDPRRFVIGFSADPANIRVLREIGGANGVYSVTPDPARSSELDAQKAGAQVVLVTQQRGLTLDPEGVLAPGQAQGFEFQATDRDREFDVVVFSERADELALTVFCIPTQDGAREIQGEQSRDSDCAPSSSIPQTPIDCHAELQPGMLTARFKLNDKILRRTHGRLGACVQFPQGRSDSPIRYSLVVVVDSQVKLDAQLYSETVPGGGVLSFSAVLTDSGLPIERAGVAVSLRHPDGGVVELDLDQCSPGRFERRLSVIRPGTYRARFVAKGFTGDGEPFRREWSRTAVIGVGTDCCR